MKIFRFSLIPLFLIAVLPLRAQNDDDAYNEHVIVTGDYKPVIDEHYKLNVMPSIVDTASEFNHKFDYSIQPRRLTSLYYPSAIKSARIIAEPRSKLYNNYLKLGLGNYWSPLFEGYYHSTTSRKLNYGLWLNHHSSWSDIGSKKEPSSYFGPNHFSLTEAAFFLKYLLSNDLQLSTDVSYQNDYNLFYGFCDTTLNSYYASRLKSDFNPDFNYRDSISTSDYRNVFNRFAFNVGIQNLQNTSSRWGYAANLHLSDLWTNFSHNELDFKLSGHVSYTLAPSNDMHRQLGLKLSLNEFYNSCVARHLPLACLDTSHSGIAQSSQGRGLLQIAPFYSFDYKWFRIHAGVMFSVNRYNNPNTARFFFFPDVTIGGRWFHDALTVALSFVGTDAPNTWDFARQRNPYVLLSDDLRSQRLYANALQLSYKFSRKVGASLGVSYNLYYDYLSFQLNDAFALRNVFQPKYESFYQWVFSGELTFVNDEMFSANIGGHYYLRGTLDGDTLPGLYHPTFDAFLGVHFNYIDKVLVHLRCDLLSQLNAAYAYDPVEQTYAITEKLPMRYGIGLEVEYRHNRALSFFLKVDNLAFQRYYYWQNYPSQKGLFTLGLTYTIH